jgi:hypothetical protein
MPASSTRASIIVPSLISRSRESDGVAGEGGASRFAAAVEAELQKGGAAPLPRWEPILATLKNTHTITRWDKTSFGTVVAPSLVVRQARAISIESKAG